MVKRLLNLYIKQMEEKDKKLWKRITLLPRKTVVQMVESQRSET